MTRTGTIRGEFEIEHPTTDDIYTVHVVIDYVDEDDTYDTPGSLYWEHKIEWVEDEHGNKYDTLEWLTEDLISDKLDDVLVNGLND